jgi:hypothetical protein
VGGQQWGQIYLSTVASKKVDLRHFILNWPNFRIPVLTKGQKCDIFILLEWSPQTRLTELPSRPDRLRRLGFVRAPRHGRRRLAGPLGTLVPFHPPPEAPHGLAHPSPPVLARSVGTRPAP